MIRLHLKPENYPGLKAEMKVSVVSEIEEVEEDLLGGDVIITILSPFSRFYHRGKNTQHLSESEIQSLIQTETENGIEAFIRYNVEQMNLLQKWFVCEKSLDA